MADFNFMSADEQNPFYCPSLPATVFLDIVRDQVRRRDSAPRLQDRKLPNTPELTHSFDEDSFPSFAKILDESLCEEDLLEMHYRPDRLRDSANDDSSLLSLSSMPWTKQKPTPFFTSGDSKGNLPDSAGPRKDSSPISFTFSDFAAPARRERSVIDVNESSFELSAKAEKLRFHTNKFSDPPDGLDSNSRLPALALPTSIEGLTSRIYALQDQLYGLPIETESPRGILSLVARLSAVLPGIRLREKLSAAGADTHQQIADSLASSGYLNTRILNILRTSEIEYLDLAPSIGDENGLNLDSNDLFHVFSKMNSFLFLAEVNLTGANVKESDLLHLQHLPRLARLWLSSTEIGNEALYYLTPLKRSLTDLDIAYNPDIDDDAIPPVLVLTKLQYMTFHGTSISMVGVRRLAKTLRDQKRDMEVEVPRQCEEYISKLSKHYLLEPAAPLITDPEVVSSLTKTAIERNLAAHSASGSEEDQEDRLAQRLRELLEIREADLLVKALILQEPLSFEDTE